MFHIIFSPQSRDDRVTYRVEGETLIINEEALDLSGIPEGATLPLYRFEFSPEGMTRSRNINCEWIDGGIERRDGVLHLTLILPYGEIPWPAPEASRAVTHPEPITVTADGPIALPSWTPEEATA